VARNCWKFKKKGWTN